MKDGLFDALEVLRVGCEKAGVNNRRSRESLAEIHNAKTWPLDQFGEDLGRPYNETLPLSP